VSRRTRCFREGELFTAHRAEFLRELRLSCPDAVALFSQSEGIYLVASEISPALPCPIRETLISIPLLMTPCRKEMRMSRARAYFRYLKAIRGGVFDQAQEAAESEGYSGQWRKWFRGHTWLRGKIGWQWTMLIVYGFAYRAGIHLDFQHRTAALGQLVSLHELGSR
jgi:hypothetical protein